MSATYNWAYKSGISNKYGFVINESEDDVKSSNTTYVALFGNDITGNGSREHPFKTISKGVSETGTFGLIIIGSGTYREVIPYDIEFITFIADGDVIFDTGINLIFTSYREVGSGFVDILFRGMNSGFGSTEEGISLTNCRFQNMSPGYWNTKITDQMQGSGNTFLNTGISTTTGYANQSKTNNTYYNCCLNLNSNPSSTPFDTTNCVYVNCNIYFSQKPTYIDYSNFYQCNFQFGATAPDLSISDNYSFYPEVPTGYTYIDNLSDLQAASDIAFGGSGDTFIHCFMVDPLFNNPEIGDVSLAINSPLKNASYSGSYIGSNSITVPIRATSTSSSGFDDDTNINLTITNDSIILTDTTQDAQIDSIVIPNLVQREILRFHSYGFMADRNGQYIDSIPDLGTVSNPNDILVYPGSYLVNTGSIIYNGLQTYEPGDRFTTATASTTFTSPAGGNVSEITEAPERHTIMARFSNGDSLPLTSGDVLTINNWYYVSVGTINYNSLDYNAGDVFKVNSGSPSHINFTGSGIITLAMDDTISYQHYEPGIKPTSNNVGDVRTGDILRGNGDPNYVRGGLNITEFPVNAKFVQIRYQIKVNNLKP